MLNRIVSIGFAVLLLAAPQAAAATDFAEALARELSSGALVAEADDETAALATLTMFYADRDMRPAWVTPEAAGERAVTLARILAAADDDALDPDDYGSADNRPR